jgi:hypothetical protein
MIGRERERRMKSMQVGNNIANFLAKPGRRISSISYRNNMLTVQYNDLSIAMFHYNELWRKAPTGETLNEHGQNILNEVLRLCREEVIRRKNKKR